MCEQENNQDIKLETKIVLEVFKNNFFIPSYQRGYRWTKNEVERLLDDIYANKDKNYCLQPIVVKKIKDNQFELIDGQQRITTLFILLQYIQTAFKIPFTLNTELEYKTRENSAEYLKNITPDKKDDNIDFWHMYNAQQTIEKWFTPQEKNAITPHDNPESIIAAFEIFVALSKTVKVIWYEIGENEDAISLFTRLNIGKIPLTNAELVKALFLADSNETISENKKQEIPFQWDYIEKELHDEIFWNFLSKQENYQTRIDLVLNLVANSENKNAYDTFFDFDKNKNNLSEYWDKTIQTFYLLKEWFEDIELYHKIGYLIVSGWSSLLSLFNLSKENKTKSDLKTAITKKIEESIVIKEKEENTGGTGTDIDNFSYENNGQATKRLLLLFNIETIRQTNNNSYRFPFHTYNKLIWSIEHIHAQNSEELPQSKWKDWIKEHKEYLEKYKHDGAKELLEEINRLEEKELTSYDFMILQNKILNFFQDEDGANIHSIDNLALLAKNDNSSLNNAIFPIKRKRIIQMEKEGTFIPPCTKNVFLKYYTPPDKEQVNYWGKADRDAYKKAIKETLKEYGLNNEKGNK